MMVHHQKKISPFRYLFFYTISFAVLIYLFTISPIDHYIATIKHSSVEENQGHENKAEQIVVMEVITISHPHQLQGFTHPTCVAFGNFDGLHRGHQQVIDKAREIAEQYSMRSGVMTFHPHPKEILEKKELVSYLTPIKDKLLYLEAMAIDVALVIQFTSAFSSLAAADFIQQYIIELEIKHVIAGFDFCFGNKGQGNIETLQKWSRATKQFELHTLPPILIENQKISSSQIRLLIQQGAVNQVQQLTNRYYKISGQVVHGHKRGRELGFPTANLEMNEAYVFPRYGVYAVVVEWQNKQYKGVANLGIKPTFEGNAPQPSIEVYLFDFNQSLYGEELHIQFIEYIRSEQKFGSLAELIEQIKKDCQRALDILENQ